jgi:hypothetical protein
MTGQSTEVQSSHRQQETRFKDSFFCSSGFQLLVAAAIYLCREMRESDLSSFFLTLNCSCIRARATPKESESLFLHRQRCGETVSRSTFDFCDVTVEFKTENVRCVRLQLYFSSFPGSSGRTGLLRLK